MSLEERAERLDILLQGLLDNLYAAQNKVSFYFRFLEKI